MEGSGELPVGFIQQKVHKVMLAASRQYRRINASYINMA
jgi:hypothetical protein